MTPPLGAAAAVSSPPEPLNEPPPRHGTSCSAARKHVSRAGNGPRPRRPAGGGQRLHGAQDGLDRRGQHHRGAAELYPLRRLPTLGARALQCPREQHHPNRGLFGGHHGIRDGPGRSGSGHGSAGIRLRPLDGDGVGNRHQPGRDLRGRTPPSEAGGRFGATVPDWPRDRRAHRLHVRGTLDGRSAGHRARRGSARGVDCDLAARWPLGLDPSGYRVLAGPSAASPQVRSRSGSAGAPSWPPPAF